MTLSLLYKRKIINDPVYGFINIPNDLIFQIIEHPWFQRLRRIKQLGLTHLVYPGALHTRFHHSLGAMYLMQQALGTLRENGHKMSAEEVQGAYIAILLHDIGHGPFSHALENSIISGIPHEEISKIFMEQLNQEFNNELATGLQIFNHSHPKTYLSQLVSGQLDVDRLDYLKRDTYFTGVSEGVIGTERIIKMLKVVDGNLVVDIKGIYSLEKFIIARRIMYWQVYLHKTVLSAENLLIKILKRASWLAKNDAELFASPALKFFLSKDYKHSVILKDPGILHQYAKLDDFDIMTSIKVWCDHPDKILSILSQKLVNRHLFRCEIQSEPFDYFYIEKLKSKIQEKYKVQDDELEYFIYTDTTSNYAYNLESEQINLVTKSGRILDIMDASDQFDRNTFSKIVTKHFICYPKDVNN